MKTLPILDLIPAGWMTRIAGTLLIITAIGLGADYVAQLLGLDMIEQVTTWQDVVTKFGEGLGLLGLRRALAPKKGD